MARQQSIFLRWQASKCFLDGPFAIPPARQNLLTCLGPLLKTPLYMFSFHTHQPLVYELIEHQI